MATPKLGCLYRATNIANGAIYVGITSKGLGARKAMHLKNAREGVDFYFYRAIRKYGAENFVWTIVADGFTWETLCAMERDEIARLKASKAKLYNMTEGGEGTLGRRVPNTESQKLKISASLKGIVRSAETRAKMSAAQKVAKAKVVWTDEMREKMSNSAKKNKLSEESRAKISAKLKGVKKPEGFAEKLKEWHASNPINEAERAARSNRMKGIARTSEEKEKNRASQMGKKHSEETKAKMRASHAKRLGKAA